MSADPTELPDLKLASAAQSGAGQSSQQDIRAEAAGDINSGIAPGRTYGYWPARWRCWRTLSIGGSADAGHSCN